MEKLRPILKKLKPILIKVSFFAVVGVIFAVMNMRHNDLGYWWPGGEMFFLVAWVIIYFFWEGEDEV